jgi:aspartate racemase
MRVIGIIGGMSWESTTAYYELINEEIKKRLGGLHSAKCLLYSVDFHEIEACQAKGDWERSGRILADAAKRLEKAGAEFIVIATNTMHKVAPQLQAQINIPILHIADATADRLEEKGIRRVGLLGTKYTMTQDFYKSRLTDRGMQVIIPGEQDIECIHSIIYEELCLGIISDESRSQFLRIIEDLSKQGAEGIILGCTEIGLLVKQADTRIPLFDTTRIHAEKAAKLAIEPVKPIALKPGDKVAVVCLSSGILGEDYCKHQMELGTKRLQEFGLIPVIMPNAVKGREYLSKHPEARAEDLKQAFLNPEIKGIICAIGGDDTYRLLPYLMEDPEFTDAVRKSPKLFTGYSDTTINHLMFHRLGMNSFYGPNFLSDLAELGQDMLPYTKRAFESYLEGREIMEYHSSDLWYEERTDFSAAALGTERIVHKEERGYEAIQGRGVFRGRLLGGCLESLYDMLTGNRYPDQKELCETYHIFPELKEWEGSILFIETCEEKPTPELFHKELMALKKTGMFNVISGILVGKPQDEAYYEEYKAVLRQVVDNKDLPILYNINFGHAHPKCILPYGLETEVDMEQKRIRFLEPLFQKG